MIQCAFFAGSVEITNHTEDGVLIRRYLRNDDQEAIRSLIERYQHRVTRLAVSILGYEHQADAEEVVQEAFLRAIQNLRSFKGRSSFSTWLYRITYNAGVDWIRRNSRHRSDQDSVSEPRPIAGGASNEEHVHLQKLRRIMVERELHKLSPAYQPPVRLYYWLGYTVKEIGELLDVPDGTVKSMLFRARKELAVVFKEAGYDQYEDFM